MPLTELEKEKLNELYAQFEEILFSSQRRQFGDYAECDAFIQNAPGIYQSFLHGSFCDRLLDEMVFGYYRYSGEKGLRELRKNPAYDKFRSELSYLDMKDPYNQIYLVIEGVFSGRKIDILPKLTIWLRAQIDRVKSENRQFDCNDFVYSLVLLLKEGYPGMWTAIGELLQCDGVEEGLPLMCAALEQVYYSENNDTIVESLMKVLQKNNNIYLAKELLGYTYYNMKMWDNALAWFEQLEDIDPRPTTIFFADTEFFWMAWCYGKRREHRKEEEYYRKVLDIFPDALDAMNNLGYSLYSQRKYKEAKDIFEECIRQNRDVRYAGNNLVRTLIAMDDIEGAKRFVAETDLHISKDLLRRLEKPTARRKDVAPEPFEDTNEAPRNVDIGVKKQQFTSEKILEDELIHRIESGIPVFGLPLKVFQKHGAYGRQFIIPNGRIDILTVDVKGNYYVIELKKDSGYDDAYLQICQYIEWIEKNMTKKGEQVFGIICLNDPSQTLKRNVATDPKVRLFEYSISYTEII